MKKKDIKKPDYNSSWEECEAYHKAYDYKYKKLIRKLKRDLHKEAREFCIWDESYLFSYMRIIFKAWEDYYTLGVRVYGVEKCDEYKMYEEHPEENGIENEEDLKKCEYMKEIPPRAEIAHNLLELLDRESDKFGDYDFEESDKRMKEFTDYFAKYIHYMWD